MRFLYALVVAPALVGSALGAAAYLLPGTGVTGTGGALLALIGAALVALGGAVALTPLPRGWLRWLLDALLGLGALLTALAAHFLMQPAFAAAMACALLGLVAALALSRRRPAR